LIEQPTGGVSTGLGSRPSSTASRAPRKKAAFCAARTISSYLLATGQRHRFALPRIRVFIGEHPTPRVFGYSTHTANSLLWIATRTVALGKAGVTVATSAVYAAKI
jgi:hypothetical protein